MEASGKVNSKKEAAFKPRNFLLDVLGLHDVNKFIDQFSPEEKKKKVPEKKKTPEEIDDDFFVSEGTTEASEMFGEEEEAIFPHDKVDKPKQPAITAARSLLPTGLPQLQKLQEQMSETLHYLVNKVLPESKGDAAKFNSLRDLREQLETSLIVISETLEKMQ